MNEYQQAFEEQSAIAFNAANQLTREKLLMLKALNTPPPAIREIFAMLGAILNSKSYTSTEWRDTKIHLAGPNTMNILLNMKYENIGQK